MTSANAILLVEDNEDDVFLLQRAFRKAGIENPLQVVIDGQQALDYLEGKEAYADRVKFPLPFVLFLDLNMPRKKGLEVLEQIRATPSLRSLMVNILSSSTRSADINRAADLGANTYFIKPTQLEKFQELIESWYRLTQFIAYPSKT